MAFKKFKKVSPDDNMQHLMLAISDVISEYTAKTPVEFQAIVGVLGYLTGAAICRGTDSNQLRRRLKDMSVINIENGMEAVRREKREFVSSLVLPPGIQ